jgi:hypothetical protein
VIARLRSFGRFWYEFVVGDDWRVAIGVAAALAMTYAVSELTSVAAWWIVPVAVLIGLPVSLLRAIRRS